MNGNIYINPKIVDINLTGIIGLDTEFNSLDTLTADCLVISLINQHKEIYVLDVNKYIKSDLVLLCKNLQKVKTIIAHHSKVEIGILYSNFGILLRNFYCTMIGSQLIDSGFKLTKNMVGKKQNLLKPHSLVGCIERYLDIKYTIEDKKGLQKSFVGLKLGSIITKEQLLYAAEDVKYLIDLYNKQLKWIKIRDLNRVVKLENDLTPVLVKMEFKGCLVDVDLHKKNIVKWKQDLKDITSDMDKELILLSDIYPALKQKKYFNKRKSNTIIQLGLFGDTNVIEVESNNINYSSTKQLKDLFNSTNNKLPTDDENKISFGEESLNMYLTNNPTSKFKNFLKYLLKYRELSKLLETYGEALLNLLDSNNRIRTNYGQVFTSTGRLNSSQIIKHILGTNLSNIPKDKDIRRIFIPDNGYSFVDSDMVGQELLIAGDFSKEPVLLKAFQEGFDHHSFLASISYSIIFGQKVEIKNESENITIGKFTYNLKKLRDTHKSCLFSKIYLGGPKRIQNVLNEFLVNHCPADNRFEICKEISNALDKALPKLLKYLKQKVKEVNIQGYSVANKLGRRRYFDFKEEAYGEAANMSIQSTGADSIKIALINIDKWIVEQSKKLNIAEDDFGWIALSVYDQNLVCLNNKYIEYASEIPTIMANAINYFLTTLVGSSDLNIKTHWNK